MVRAHATAFPLGAELLLQEPVGVAPRAVYREIHCTEEIGTRDGVRDWCRDALRGEEVEATAVRAGGPRLRPLDLKHTHATLLLRAGTPIKAVSERLGHAKTSITLGTYAHVLPDMQDHAVDAIDAALFQRCA